MKINNKTVVIINFDGYVKLYADTLSYVSQRLQKSRYDVIHLGCSGVLKTCTSVNSLGPKKLSLEDRKNICNQCINIGQASISSNRKITINESDSILTEAEYRYVKSVELALAINRTAASVMLREHQELQYVRIAFFDFSIKHKLNEQTKLDNFLIEALMEAVVDLFAIKHSLVRLNFGETPQTFISINGNYSHATFVREYFKNRNLNHLTIENQFSSASAFNKIFIRKNRIEIAQDALINPAIDIKARDISVIHASRVLKIFSRRILGKEFNAYTSLKPVEFEKKTLDQLNKFTNFYKNIHTFFFSSEDELAPHVATHRSAKNIDFEDVEPWESQAVFTEYLIKEAERHPETGFILRLHPRMATNKRDAFESEEHKKYIKLLETTSLAKNILAIYGDSKISSYYIANISNLVVVTWSTMGLESLLLGKRVIAVFPSFLSYPIGKISKQPLDRSQLKKALFEQTDLGLPIDRELLRWVSIAYEQQFFTVLASRTPGADPLGWLFWKVFNLRLWSKAFKTTISALFTALLFNAKPADELLYVVKMRRPFSIETWMSQTLLRRYRKRNQNLLNKYIKHLSS